tara:strand:+ start:1500 stop:2723 length:1224 start_codon:yes stop_codon:yes gene_type:complete
MIKESTIKNTNLPAGWVLNKLDSCVSQFIVPQRDRPKVFDGNVPWCRIEDIDGIYLSKSKSGLAVSQKLIDSMPLRVYPKGTVIVSCSADLGRCAIISVPLITNQTFIGLVPSENIDSLYLYYLMGSKSKELNEMATGATIKYLSKKKFQNIEIPLPALNQQKQIVSILDKAFAAIETAKANAGQNLQNAKELFESYLQNVFENKGDNWEEKTLGEILQKTETVNPKSTPNNEFVYLDVSSVNKETKLIETATVLLGQDAPSRARKLVKTNDIIFATVRPTHSRVAIITDEYNNQVCSTGYYVLRPKNIIESHYLFYFILTFGFNKLMESMQKGASYPAVNNKEVESVVINFPKSIKEQQKIVERLDSLSTETKKLESIYTQKIADLEEMKKSVLQKAFSGQLNTIN